MLKPATFILILLSIAVPKTGAQDASTPDLTTLTSISEPYVLDPPLDCNSSTSDFANAVNSVHGNVSYGDTNLINSVAPENKLFSAVRMIIRPDANCTFSSVLVASINSTRTMYQNGPSYTQCHDSNALNETIPLPFTNSFIMVFYNNNADESVCLVDAHFDFEFVDAPPAIDDGNGDVTSPEEDPQTEENDEGLIDDTTSSENSGNNTATAETNTTVTDDEVSGSAVFAGTSRGPSVTFSAGTKIYNSVFVGFLGALVAVISFI